MADIKAPWAVCLKESNSDQSVEYSVVRIDFDHGFRSYGWEEPDRKQIVAGSGGHCRYQYTALLKAHLKKVAIQYAQELNTLEGHGEFNVMWYETQNAKDTSCDVKLTLVSVMDEASAIARILYEDLKVGHPKLNANPELTTRITETLLILTTLFRLYADGTVATDALITATADATNLVYEYRSETGPFSTPTRVTKDAE